jgi:4'-phosphopantetheinyl transferase
MRHWPEGPLSPVLGPADVHVWSMALHVEPAESMELERCLSVHERCRADRFAFDADRARFVVGRGLLRTILARYSGAPPSEIRFRTNEYGKPSLECERDEGSALQFNFSHSDSIALCALSRGRAVGVDIERERPLPALEEIAERYFSAREHAALCELPEELRRRAFFACWSRKEAYIKARGLGMSLPLASFDVSLAPDEPAMLLAVRGEPEASARWALYDLDPADGFAAALVVERAGDGAGDGTQLGCYGWHAGRIQQPTALRANPPVPGSLSE